jgi:signal transduction histidine kinase/DNA-binding response OmpR family regulator
MVSKDIYTDLRRQTLGWSVVLIGAGAWISLLVADVATHRLSTQWISGTLATVAICAALFFLRVNHLRLACYLAAMGMWIGNAALAIYVPQPIFLYLFGIIIVLSGSIIRLPFTVMMTILSTLLLIGVTGGLAQSIGPLINVWGSLIVGVVVSRAYYQALETIKRHHNYSLEQMNLARDHRAQLFKLTKALQETTEDLRHTNIQLRYAREAADEARRLKVQFAANVSHELRTPINLVIGYSEVMVMSPEVYGAPLPPNYRSDIHAIYRNAKHLQDLINDILDISQIEAARLAVTKERTNLRSTVLEAVKMISDLVDAKGLQLHLELPVELSDVFIDSTRIRQVVLNLLANAVRFTDKGSITLRVRQDRGEIKVSIIDTGVGIPKEELDRVFEEFYQIDNHRLSKQGGTGLGLTLSLQIIQHHGGKMWAESEGIAGHGSTFSFTLPTSADTQSAIKHPMLRTVASHDPKCVVLYDDDAAVGQLFKRYLNKHEVVVSQSHDDALRLTQMIQPSAVVLDRNQRNAEFEAELVNRSRDTAIIFCPMPSVQRASHAYGVANYLVKPITRQVLINAIEALERPIQKILVIDDERDVTRMLSRMLQSYDQYYTIWQANNGEDGLAMMYRERPDVVLLDIQMPTIDGFSVIQRMKQDPMLQQIPVILASARSTEEAAASTVQGEITIVRPQGFSAVELVNCVDAVVNVLMPSTGAALPKN